MRRTAGEAREARGGQVGARDALLIPVALIALFDAAADVVPDDGRKY